MLQVGQKSSSEANEKTKAKGQTAESGEDNERTTSGCACADKRDN